MMPGYVDTGPTYEGYTDEMIIGNLEKNIETIYKNNIYTFKKYIFWNMVKTNHRTVQQILVKG